MNSTVWWYLWNKVQSHWRASSLFRVPPARDFTRTFNGFQLNKIQVCYALHMLLSMYTSTAVYSPESKGEQQHPPPPPRGTTEDSSCFLRELFLSNFVLSTCICMHIYEKKKGQIPLRPSLGKHNIQVKEAYSSPKEESGDRLWAGFRFCDPAAVTAWCSPHALHKKPAPSTLAVSETKIGNFQDDENIRHFHMGPARWWRRTQNPGSSSARHMQTFKKCLEVNS